jgi:hypothetical protein
MARIEMKVRRMDTGETLVAELGSFADAVAWLEERPEGTEVLGVLSKDLSPEQHQALRASLRPYSASERRLIAAADRRAGEAIAARLAEETKLAARRMREHAEAQRRADPNRPMDLRWDLTEGLSKADPYDPREITDAVKQAVVAWVAERGTWVEGRGQQVVEATLQAYPGPVPGGDEADRVVPGGQFVAGPR